MDNKSLINLIRDKSGIIKFLLDTIVKSDEVSSGLRKYMKSDNVSEEKKIKVLLEITANQSIQIKKLASLLLIYTQSNSFTSDVAKMAMKLNNGDGSDILQAVIEDKFKNQ